MTARLPASNPTRGSADGLLLAASAASGTTATPAARKSLRVEADSMLASHAAGVGWGVAAVWCYFTAFAVHVVRPGPVREREVRAVLIASQRRGLEYAVDSHEIFAPAAVIRIRVEDGPGRIL